MKIVRITACILLFILLSLPVSAQSDCVIEEIKIIGPTRSNEKILERQIPFAVGDKWNNNLKKLTYKRIKALNIFDPVELRVLSEPIGKNQVRVVIRANDTNILYVDPLQYLITKSVELSNNYFQQLLINPAGKGYNIRGGCKWDSDNWWYLYLSCIGRDGHIYSGKYKNFTVSESYNNENYQMDGYQTCFRVKTIPGADWELDYFIDYRDNNYEKEDINNKQKYMLLGTDIVYSRNGESSLRLVTGQSFSEEQPTFSKITLSYYKDYNFENDNIIINIRGGITSADTPLNYQFHGGGFSSISLRGHNKNMAGDRYLAGNIEYHKNIHKNVDLIFFIDSGKVVQVEKDFCDEELIVDGGIGITYNTPSNIPVRLDIGYNFTDSDYNVNIGFGQTY